LRGASLNEDTVDQNPVVDARVAPIGNRLYRRLATGEPADGHSAPPEFARVLIRICARITPQSHEHHRGFWFQNVNLQPIFHSINREEGFA